MRLTNNQAILLVHEVHRERATFRTFKTIKETTDFLHDWKRGGAIFDANDWYVYVLDTTVEMNIYQLLEEMNKPKDDSIWQDYATHGQVVMAIKVYRDEYRTTLLESKNLVEAWLKNQEEP